VIAAAAVTTAMAAEAAALGHASASRLPPQVPSPTLPCTVMDDSDAGAFRGEGTELTERDMIRLKISAAARERLSRRPAGPASATRAGPYP
jgi:hypothetical protein